MSNRRTVTVRDYKTQAVRYDGTRALAEVYLTVCYGIAPHDSEKILALAAEYGIATDFPEHGISVTVNQELNA